MRLVEARAAHDMALERTALGEAIQIARRGQILALAMGLATLTGSLAAAITGHDGAAITLAATSLLGVVAAFLGVRLGSKPERRGVSP